MLQHSVLSVFLVVVALLAGGSFVQPTHAWGHEGHIITVEVATAYLTPAAERGICELIPSCNLSSGANWADEARGSHLWSAPLHYVNTEDCPPTECGFDETRDCPDGFCVIGAIRNYTNQLLHADTKFNLTEALLFLIHFVGDIHQPLHVAGRDRGGNDFEVYFYNKRTNLHSVWDSAMVQKRTSEDGGQYYQFLNEILLLMRTTWANLTESWKRCQDGGFDCPQEWALEGVMENCVNIWPTTTCEPANNKFFELHKKHPENFDFFSEFENLHYEVDESRSTKLKSLSHFQQGKSEPHLDDVYYKENLPVIQMQIARSGLRMANILNNIWK